MLRGFDTFTQRKLDNLLIRNSSNILGAMASRFTDIGLNPMDSISFKGLEKASPLVNALLRDLVRARKNLGEEMNLSEGRKSVVIDWKDLDAFGPELERFGLAEKDPATGKYVQKSREDMQAMEEASHKAVMDIIKDDDGAGVGVRKYTDENGNVVEILTGGKFSPEQMAAIGDSAAILPAVRENLKALINHMRDGDVVNFDGLEATGRTKNRRTKKYRSTYNPSLRKSNRDAVIYALEVTKAGNITARAMNWSNVNTYARQKAKKGELGPWGNRPADFIADLRTYLENLSSTDPVRTRKLFADEKKAQILHDFVQDQKKGGSRFFRTYRLDRMGNIQPTSERVKLSEEAIQLSKIRWQPDSFTPEKLPGGEAFVHESGYNILKKGRGKFRVYKPDGELLGLRDTMKSAASLAGRNFRKGEARFMAAAKRPVQPSLFGKEMVKDAKKKIRESKKMFPEAVPLKLKLEKDGSVKIGERVDKETGETITDVEFDQVPYGLMKAPIFPKNLSRAKSDSPVYKRAVSKGADHVVDQYNKWSGNPEITKAKGWYGKMRNWLQENFGASMEMFSQLLGATSARTGVVDNFKQARMAIRKYSQGDYDGLMGRFHDHVTETKRKADSGELFNEWKARETQKKNPAPDSAFNPLTEYRKEINKFDELPLKDNNTKYNANSMAVLKALYGNWLETTRGPKTPNFSGNLTGRTLEATIDVWAARLLRRLFYSGKRKQWRIRPEQEKGVDYNLTKGGEYTGDFPFAQRVFREAADRIGISPDDLQAIVWFGEKDVWGKEGWTGKTGKEKSSFEQEAGAMDVERFHAGVTTYRGEGFNPELFTKAKDYLRKRVGANRDLLASRVTESEGYYAKEMEPSFDAEFSTKKGADIHDIVEGVMDIGGDPRFTQDDIFISAIVSNKHPNARPSIEVGFKSPATKAQADAVMDVFIAEGVDGFTLAKDERGNVLGVRAQYVPEISARWEEGHLNYDDFLNNSAQWLSKAQKAVANLDKGAISYAEARPVSTIVYGREEYKSAPVLDPRRSDARSELGRRRHNLQTRAGLSETGVPRFQPSSESGGGGSARGRGPVRPDDAGPASGVALAAQSSRFQPAESLTNGTAWRNGAGYNVLQKGKRGKFRAYAPSGKLIGIYDRLETAQKAAIRLQEKETNLINQ